MYVKLFNMFVKSNIHACILFYMFAKSSHKHVNYSAISVTTRKFSAMFGYSAHRPIILLVSCSSFCAGGIVLWFYPRGVFRGHF